MSEPSTRPERDVRSGRRRRSFAELVRDRRIGPTAVIALAALAGLVVWLVVESGGSSTKTATSTTNPPVALSSSGLRTLAKAVPQPIYWVGSRRGTMYELTRTPDRVYLRYLPRGVDAGDPRPFLTIGTYNMRGAYDVMKKDAGGSGVVTVNTAGGGIAVFNKSHPTSIYLAYPGSDYQVEVYSPDVAAARRLVRGGRVQPVVKTAQPASIGGPIAATPDKLRSLAASLGHPIYWAGSRGNTTYELTETDSGRTYVRYLPRGVPVGDKKPYLTIATYPLKNAYTVTKASGKDPNTVTIKLANGRIGVYRKKNPRNIHLADPGSDVQVEVYDPSPRVPPKLVSSGLVAPVG